LPTLCVFGAAADGVQGTESPRNRIASNFPNGLKANLLDHRYLRRPFIGLRFVTLFG
jgi:hypothetical protein